MDTGAAVQVNVVMMGALPDGSGPMPAIDIATLANRYVLRLSPDAADQLADQLPTMLREMANECRRIASGLIVAQNIEE